MNMDLSEEEKTKKGSEDAGRYFRYMAEFVGFTDADAQAIRESGLIIEKHLPDIVSQFYEHLLRYPPMRKFFMRRDGTLDQEYLTMRMHHQANFWRRTAAGIYDDDYARFLDYVGRAHTSRGADPSIYIAERYVIGQIGFVQHAITEALTNELREYNPDLEQRAVKSWNLLMMIILELLARAYGEEHEEETDQQLFAVDPRPVFQMAVDAYEQGLGLVRPTPIKDVLVAKVDEIADGERKIVQVDGFSIGIFHHHGKWVAFQNKCLHRGGPVATGSLEGDVLICPWHGFQYNVNDGKLISDPSSHLQNFPITISGDEIHLSVPDLAQASAEREAPTAPVQQKRSLQPNELWVKDLPAGGVRKVRVNGKEVAVYRVGDAYYATQENCTHAGGPLSEGDLDGNIITCPWHGSCFDVTTGAVKCGPARQPVQVFHPKVDGDVLKVEE